MKGFSLAFWKMIHLVFCTCVIGTIHVEYKYFSKGEAITLKCKCVVFYWNGPAQNIANRHQVSQVEMLDMKGNPRIWSISIYTKGDNIADTLSQQLSKRLSLIGANFDLHITNLSSSDEGLYICDTSVKCIFPQYRFILYMKYKPSIKVNVKDKIIIVEGEPVDLYCATKNNHKTTSIVWYAGNKKLISTNESSLNYKISNVNRFDTGNYTCSVQTEVGNTFSEISLVISYPPVVNVRKKKLSEDRLLTEIQCVAQGEPNNYNYFPWEHRSRFDEHIRYLAAIDVRHRQLPGVNVSNTYQNTGFYVCKVLNGIPDYHGNFLQQGRVYVEFEGPPVFAANTKRLQEITKESAIKVKVYSSSEITCHKITEICGISFIEIGVTTRPVLFKESFHGAIVTLNGTEIVFVLNVLNAVEIHSFNITVCNIYGRSSFVINSKHFVKSSKEKALSSQRIINIILLIIILVLVTGIGVYVWYMKHRYRKKMITAVSIQTAERTVNENPHYTEIIEGDSILTPPPGNNTQIISEPNRVVVENSNTAALSVGRSSSSSNTDINVSEDSNDGYEKPYTTLVTIKGNEVEHVYHKTKQNWNYGNSTALKNATFGHSVEYTEQVISLDEINTNVYANEGQESANINFGENYTKKTDDGFQRSNVHKHKEPKEYINLLLKQ